MSGKICPLGFTANEWEICLQKKCAWWDDDRKQCAIVSIACQSIEERVKADYWGCENCKYWKRTDDECGKCSNKHQTSVTTMSWVQCSWWEYKPPKAKEV